MYIYSDSRGKLMDMEFEEFLIYHLLNDIGALNRITVTSVVWNIITCVDFYYRIRWWFRRVSLIKAYEFSFILIEGQEIILKPVCSNSHISICSINCVPPVFIFENNNGVVRICTGRY
jgi:hypothetical protein